MAQVDAPVRIVGYVSPAELEAIRAAAKTEDRSVAAWLRQAIRDRLGKGTA